MDLPFSPDLVMGSVRVSWHSIFSFVGALAAAGVVLAAVYLLWMYQRVFLGEITNEKNRALMDCNLREKIVLGAAVAVIFLMGIYPQPFLRRMDTTVTAVLRRVQPGTSYAHVRAPACGPKSLTLQSYGDEAPFGARRPGTRSAAHSGGR